METTVLVPGDRDVRATLSTPTTHDAERVRAGDRLGDRAVVACPPHPQFGGSRTDRRLTAVDDALADRGVACLRFDYGPWDAGRGERTDARRAVEWASRRFDRVGLFGFSFGGGVATLAAAALGTGTGIGGGPGHDADSDADPGREPETGSGAETGTGPGVEVGALSVLAPASNPGDGPDTDAVAALDEVRCPVQVVYGERDDTADWKPLVERARALGATVEAFPADHFFVGQAPKVAALVAEFQVDRL